jgi:Tol biopolymer transport system component
MLFYSRQMGIRVNRFMPGDGDVVSAFTEIRIEFQETMERESVETRLLIQPEMDGGFVWSENVVTFTPESPLSPGTVYSITLLAGSRGSKGDAIKGDVHWEFKVRDPEILYLAPSLRPSELWKVSSNPENATPLLLTDTGGRIFDYAISPDGGFIAYVVMNDDGGVDLWLMTSEGDDARPIIECGSDRCTSPAWSPDGRQLAYSRAENTVGVSGWRSPRIWTLALSSGLTAPLFQDSQIMGYGASFSPDGRRLAFIYGNVGVIRILDLESGEQEILESSLGQVGEWSPDGTCMIYNGIRADGDTAVTELFLSDLAADEIYVVLGLESQFKEPGEPKWSPTGDWIAINLRTETSGSGKELWLISLEGEQSVPVARDPEYFYAGYHWDPWGQALVFQRYLLGVEDAKPDIMIWEMGSSEARILVSDAWWARWLP